MGEQVCRARILAVRAACSMIGQGRVVGEPPRPYWNSPRWCHVRPRPVSSALCDWTRSFGELMSLPLSKDFCRSRNASRKPPDGRVGAGFVDNRPQKTAVNPLPRLANRSVIRRDLSSRCTLRGLLRPSIHCLTELHVKLPVGLTFFGKASSGRPHEHQAMISKRSPDDPLKGLTHETRISGSHPCCCHRSLSPDGLRANPQDGQGPWHAFLWREPGSAGVLDAGRQG